MKKLDFVNKTVELTIINIIKSFKMEEMETVGRKKLTIDMEVFGYLFELYLDDVVSLDEILKKLDITKTTFYKLQQLYLIIRQLQNLKQIAFRFKNEEGEEKLIHIKELYALANEVVNGEYLKNIKKGGGENE